MQIRISTWNAKGDEALRVYDRDLATDAEIEEVNEYIHNLEKTMGVRAFDSVTGEAVEKLTRQNSDIDLIPQMAGG